LNITPTAGTYVVTTTTEVSSSTNTRAVYNQLFVNGVATGTIVSVFIATAGNRAIITCMNKITVNGSQNVDLRWRVDSNTGTMTSRNMLIIEVSP
jgi:translation elongation factor EF-4